MSVSVSRRNFLCGAVGLTASMIAGRAVASQQAPKFIDVHTHLGRYRQWDKNLTAEGLIQWMDEHQVEKSVVLPLVSPEATTFLQPTEVVLEECRKFPDRLIPFCAIDPRTHYGNKNALLDILRRYKDQGAKGFGEHKVGLPFDHPLMMRVYEACQEVGLPLLFHLDNVRGTDEPGLPGLRRALTSFPKLTFIGHGPGWWASISGDAKALGDYPTGPVTPGGAIDLLMDKFDNIYGDLSAGSGSNAISRDPKFGREFLIRRADRLMFGTDYLAPGQAVPQFELLRSIELPDEVRHKIYRGNAERILGLT